MKKMKLNKNRRVTRNICLKLYQEAHLNEICDRLGMEKSPVIQMLIDQYYAEMIGKKNADHLNNEEKYGIEIHDPPENPPLYDVPSDASRNRELIEKSKGK